MEAILEEYDYTEEFYFQWHITERCNLRCKHCYHDDYVDLGLPLEKLKNIANHICDVLDKWKKKGAISITGGEPFERKEEIFELLKLFKARNIPRVDILTNGTTIDEYIISRLKEFDNLRRIQISLEGLKETNDKIRGKGTFDKIIEKIKLLKSNEFKVSVMMTVGRHNQDEIFELADMLGEIGVDAFIIERFIPEGQGSNNKEWLLTANEIKNVYEKAYEYFKNFDKPKFLLYRTLFCLLNPSDQHIGAMCSMGNNALTVVSNGDVLPCRRVPKVIGNLLDDTIYNIWYNSKLLWEVRNPENLKGKCNNCEYIPLCRGCRAVAYALTGDYLEEDVQCWR